MAHMRLLHMHDQNPSFRMRGYFFMMTLSLIPSPHDSADHVFFKNVVAAALRAARL